MGIRAGQHGFPVLESDSEGAQKHVAIVVAMVLVLQVHVWTDHAAQRKHRHLKLRTCPNEHAGHSLRLVVQLEVVLKHEPGLQNSTFEAPRKTPAQNVPLPACRGSGTLCSPNDPCSPP